MLNIIWVLFFIAAFVAAIVKSFFMGESGVWTELVAATFSSSKNAFTISLNLTGILCLWLGLLKIAEQSGITNLLSKALAPLFRKIMPEVPQGHPAMGSIIMNMAANVLGLDNAATPMGLKAMEQLQELNPKKDTASNAQILFMVLNASAITLIPITILMYRAELGSANPAAVFMPILFATSVSTLVGFLSVAWAQKLHIFNRVILAYLAAFAAFIFLTGWYFNSLPAETRLAVSAEWGNGILFSVIVTFIAAGLIKKLNVYDVFIQGAKEGFEIAVRIIPYLVAMLVAIAVLRSSGVLDLIVLGFGKIFALIGIDTAFVAALPTALLKPLSGSGARAMMIETMQTYGADSFPAFVSCIVQGSTETTFYVLSVYFGAIGIKKFRHAVLTGILADITGIFAAIIICRWLFL